MNQDDASSPAPDVAWILPGGHGSPAQALARIEALCAGFPDLFSAMLAVLATHQAVSREILALAILQFRADTADLNKDAVVGLLTSVVQGGRPGFEAVLRARRKGERKAVALPWVKD
jgi:hypothetical protein